MRKSFSGRKRGTTVPFFASLTTFFRRRITNKNRCDKIGGIVSLKESFTCSLPCLLFRALLILFKIAFLYSAVSKFLKEARIVTVVHAKIVDENRQRITLIILTVLTVFSRRIQFFLLFNREVTN